MKELLEASIAWTTLPFTVILVLIGLYWFVVILGLIDLEWLDALVGVDLDVDLDVEGDVEAEAAPSGLLHSILKLFHFAEMPMMIPISLFSLSAWIVAVLGNHYFNPGALVWAAAVILVANLLISAVIMRYASQPFAVLFRKLNEQPDTIRHVEGSPCTLVTPLSAGKIGQAEIRFKGSSVLLNVTMQKGPDLPKGTEAVVIMRAGDKDLYTIKPLNLED